MSRRIPVPFLALGLVALLVPGPPPGAARAEGETAPTSSPKARLVIDPSEHDFGWAGQEQDLEAQFTYRNAGDAPLTGIRAIGDCGCYGVSLSKTDLAPGESGTLKLTFRTLMFVGKHTKVLKVLTGDPADIPLQVKLTVNVISGVIVDPRRLNFGDVLAGTSPSQTVIAKWHQEAGTPFKVTSVEVPGHEFEVTTAAYEQGDWRGTAITFAFRKAPPLGMLSATALLRTDHPDYPRISIPVTANVSGKVWVQSRTVFFGWVTRGKVKSTALLVRPFAPEVDLGEVSAASRKGTVKVSTSKSATGRPGWWEVRIEVPADAPVGKIDDVLEIRTAVPGEEVTAIEVRGEVLDLGG